MTSQTIARREYCWIAWQKLSRREWFLQRFLSTSLAACSLRPAHTQMMTNNALWLPLCKYLTKARGKKLLKNFLSYCYFMAESGNNKRKLTDKKILPSVTISARIQKVRTHSCTQLEKWKQTGRKKVAAFVLQFTMEQFSPPSEIWGFCLSRRMVFQTFLHVMHIF